MSFIPVVKWGMDWRGVQFRRTRTDSWKRSGRERSVSGRGSGCTVEACLSLFPEEHSYFSQDCSPHSFIHTCIHSFNEYLFCSFYKHWGYNSKQNHFHSHRGCDILIVQLTSSHFTKCLLQCLVIPGPKGKHEFWWHFKPQDKGWDIWIKNR